MTIDGKHITDADFHASREYKLAERLADEVNVSGFNHGLFSEAMRRQHRFLQSEVANMFLRWMEAVGGPDYGVDGRNDWILEVVDALRKAEIIY